MLFGSVRERLNYRAVAHKDFGAPKRSILTTEWAARCTWEGNGEHAILSMEICAVPCETANSNLFGFDSSPSPFGTGGEQ